ncbi:MAG: OmpA family protein [Pseudomonadota bacterium]
MRGIKIGIACAIAVIAMGDATVYAQSTDQSILQRQREKLIKQRQEQARSRSLLEISPTTKEVEKKSQPAATAVVSPTQNQQAVKKTAKKKTPAPQQVIARAETPPELAPEDQLFRPIEFAYDSANISDQARGILDGLCDTLKVDLSVNPGSSYFVIGHTDATGSATYNNSLSQRRADATKQYLVSNCGITTAQLKAVGMGEERLLAQFDPSAANQRRVEIQVRDTGTDN